MLLELKHVHALWLIGFYSQPLLVYPRSQSVPSGCPIQSVKMSKVGYVNTAGSAGSQTYTMNTGMSSIHYMTYFSTLKLIKTSKININKF